jgi:uncharacterized membrane protein YbhN (UPF0104 family)
MHAETDDGDRGLTAAFVLAYVIALAALVALVIEGGVWNLLGNSRLLDVLARGGVIAVTDADQGIVSGLPSLDYYVAAQDSIDWELIVLAVGMFVLSWAAKGAQFHGVARVLGVDGSLGQHARAWFYGHGVNRLVPYDAGKVAAATALEGQGTPPDRAAQVVFVASLLAVAEVAVLALYGLFAVGLGMWVRQLFWALVILGVAWLMVRPGGEEGRASRREGRAAAAAAARDLARRPAVLARLVLFGVVALVLLDLGAYAVSQAFTSTNVIINVPGDVLLMAVVAGYVARLVAFTPGGIGQWEWAFASALYAGGLGFPESMTLAILVTAVRYAAGALIFGAVTVGFGVETSLSRVLGIFRRPAARPEGAAP